MTKIVALKGKHENWRSLLASIMEDDAVSSFVIVTMSKDDDVGFAHFQMTRANLAYAALLIQEKARE